MQTRYKIRFSIVSDSNYETKLGDLSFHTRELEDWMYFKDYGNDLSVIGVCLMCRSPEYNFKQRIRLERKNKALYLDLMLDYYYFTSGASVEERQKVVGKKIIDEIPIIIRKYKLKEFDLDSFMEDLKTKHLKKIGWI